MNEPKKRGRPSKADIAARDAIDPLSRSAVQVFTPVREYLGDEATNDEMTLDKEPFSSSAQAYALRVWHGQSPTADRPWRIERVKQALEAQGLSMEGVELP